MARINRAYDQFPSTSGGVGTLSITLTAGSLVICKMMGTNDFGADTATGVLGNTYTLFKKESISGFNDCIVGFYCYNANGGSETITFSGPFSYVVYEIEEYNGIKTSSDPLLTTGSAQGSSSPLTSALSITATATVIGAWFNKDVDDVTGFSNLTSIYHETTGGQQYSAAGESFAVTSGTANPGFNISGDTDNVSIFAAFEEASSGTSVDAQPGTGVITYTGFAPTVVATDNKNVLPGVGVVTYTGFSPTVFATDNKVILPGTGVITFTGYSPTISLPVNISANTGVITYAGFSPSVSGGGNVQVLPDTGLIQYTGYSPVVFATDTINVLPGTGQITFIGYSPVVFASDSKNVSPDTGIVLYAGYSPSVIITTGGVNVSAGIGIVLYSGYAPRVKSLANGTVIYKSAVNNNSSINSPSAISNSTIVNKQGFSNTTIVNTDE